MKFTESQLEQAHISLLEAQVSSLVSSLKVEHNSRPRNPKIADACFKSGYIDAWGRGTLKIIEACKEAGLPEPELIEKDGGVQVTLYKNTKSGLVDGLVDGLVESQQLIVQMIFENPKVSKRELAEKIGISTTAIDKNISSLKERGIIRRIGTDRSGHWQIIHQKK